MKFNEELMQSISKEFLILRKLDIWTDEISVEAYAHMNRELYLSQVLNAPGPGAVLREDFRLRTEYLDKRRKKTRRAKGKK